MSINKSIKIISSITSVTAFAPATCANVAVGFDILGFALGFTGDTVKLSPRKDQKIVLNSILATEELPQDPDKNIASAVIKHAVNLLGLKTGFSIDLKKGIPLGSGMGGSAASAVAALVALNQFLEPKLSLQELANFALFGEKIASGTEHADNVIPCLFGGLTFVYSQEPIKVINLPIPEIKCVIIHPHLYVATQDARNTLDATVPLKSYIQQSRNLALFISAIYIQNIKLIQESLDDILIEPQRAKFVPGFYKIKAAALKAGALGMSFSGSGPAMFAFAANYETAEQVGIAMKNILRQEKIDANYWISEISHQAAHVIEEC